MKTKPYLQSLILKNTALRKVFSLKKSTHYLLVATTFCTATQVFAYDLWQAYQDALANDATYLAAVAQDQAAMQQQKQAQAALKPTILASANIRRVDETRSGVTAPILVPAQAGLSVNMPILALDRLVIVRQVKENTSLSALQLAQAKQDLMVRVVQAYFSAWLAQEAKDIAYKQQTAAEKQWKNASARFEVGQVTIIDKQEAQAAFFNAQSTYIKAQSQAEIARQQLADLAGRETIDEPLARLKQPLALKNPQPASSTAWVNLAKQQHFMVQIAKKNLTLNELEVKKRQRKRAPQLSVVASSTWRHTNYQRDKDVFSQNYTAGLELSMPIYDGGLIRAEVLEAEALKTKATQQMRQSELGAGQGALVAYNQALAGLKNIEALEAANKAAKESVRSNQVGYQLGMRINIDVLNAQNLSAQTEYNLLQAQYDAVLGNIRLKEAIAALGEADIHYVNDLLVKTSSQTPKRNVVNKNNMKK